MDRWSVLDRSGQAGPVACRGRRLLEPGSFAGEPVRI